MKIGFISDSVKILIFAAAVIITCILVALGFRAAAVAQEISNSAILQMAELNNDLQNSDVMMFHQAEVYGSDVVNCLKRYLGDYAVGETAPIYIFVDTNLSANTYTNGSYIDEIRNFTNSRYVKPTAVFEGTVVENANHVIVGITFIKR